VIEIGVSCGHSDDTSLSRVEQTRRSFAELVSPGNGRLNGDLDQAALHIAQALDPDVVIVEQLKRLDRLSADISASSAADVALTLFGGAEHDPARHFSGNAAAYFDPSNSLLHRVLDRRVGIPISLAVLLIEVARRKGIHLHGVGMPGHFLVGSKDGFIDTFHGGVLLDQAGCYALFARLSGKPARLPPDALDPTPPALIIKRMLYNLSGIGANQQERRTLRAARSLLAAFPDADHRDHVQHAYAAAEIGQYDEAAHAAERAMKTIPQAVQAKLGSQIEIWRARLN